MNASTPERDRLREALVAALHGNYPYPTLAAAILLEWDAHVPVRVEEPAGERVGDETEALRSEQHALLAALVLDPENDDPAEFTFAQLLERTEQHMGHGWHQAGLELQRTEEALARVAGLEAMEASLAEEVAALGAGWKEAMAISDEYLARAEKAEDLLARQGNTEDGCPECGHPFEAHVEGEGTCSTCGCVAWGKPTAADLERAQEVADMLGFRASGTDADSGEAGS